MHCLSFAIHLDLFSYISAISVVNKWTDFRFILSMFQLGYCTNQSGPESLSALLLLFLLKMGFLVFQQGTLNLGGSCYSAVAADSIDLARYKT